jgi:hypothetical protein
MSPNCPQLSNILTDIVNGRARDAYAVRSRLDNAMPRQLCLASPLERSSRTRRLDRQRGGKRSPPRPARVAERPLQPGDSLG